MKKMMKRIISLTAVLTMLCAFVPVVTSASMSISIGDYLQMGTYYGEPILWRCVDIDENGSLMLSDKIICIKPFDAMGEANTTTGSHSRGSYRQSWGSNYWEDSNIRSWLNSTASAGNVEWFCGNPPDKDHLYDGYNAYDQEAGFLTNFTRSERNAIKEVTQKSLVAYPEYKNGIYDGGTEGHIYKNELPPEALQNYDKAYYKNVTDKMFLLDVKQVSVVYNNSDVLGEDYYIGEPTAECVANSEYQVGNKCCYWLRSPDYDGYYCVRCVNTNGTVKLDCAYAGFYGIRPAFYLNLTSSSIKSGSGTETNPYTINGGSEPIVTPSPLPSTNPTTTPTTAPSPSPAPTPKSTPIPLCFTVSDGVIKNISDEEQAAAVIVAAYDGSRLDYVISYDHVFSAGEEWEPYVPDGGKVFVWNSLNGMQPLNK